MRPPNADRRLGHPAWLLAGLFVLAGLAGCVVDDDAADQSAENEAPQAELETSKDVAWTGEHVKFDASGSSDSDGNVSEWRFDFGDGTEATAEREDEAEDMKHTYAHGGEYTVTVTVTDNGAEQAGAKTDTASVDLSINEKREIIAQVVKPTEANASQASEHTVPFETFEGVDQFALDATVEATAPAGASEITVQVLDPEGEVVDEETVTVSAGENETVNLDGLLDDEGNHEVKVIAESGAANVHGELRVYYGGETTSA